MHMDSTKLAALYGALVSTFAVIWNVYRDFHDRACIELSAKVGYVVKGGNRNYIATREFLLDRRPDIFQNARPSLFLTITNTGRRPVLVEGWAIRTDIKKTGNENSIFPLTTLPKMLREGEYAVEQTDDLSLLRTGARGIYAWDSARKNWSLSRRDLRKLQREVKSVEEEG